MTDAQVHLWEVDRADRPWPKGQQRPPHRLNGFSAEEMLAEMNAAGVDRAVIAPPHWVAAITKRGKRFSFFSVRMECYAAESIIGGR